MEINEELVVCKTTICGKEYETYIKAEDWKEIAEKFKNKTGYERVKKDELYWYNNRIGEADSEQEDEMVVDDELYMSANYYCSKEIAENNARADQLMRQLRRFAVENRKVSNPQKKHYIYWMEHENILQLSTSLNERSMGVWFDSVEAGGNAIKTYEEELKWYFTEYKDSL